MHGGPLAVPAQQHRHHEIVADHDGERDGLDNHHGGGSGKAADEGDEREGRTSRTHGKGQHECVAIGSGRQQQKAGDGDRHNEEIDGHKIEREEPGRAADIRGMRVLHHAHMELARQEDDGEGSEQCQGQPTAAIEVFRKERRRGSTRGDFARHRRETAGHGECDEQADADEGDELHNGLDGDGENHAVLVLGRVDMAGAEEDREGAHRQRDEHGRIRTAQRCGRDGVERSRHCLQLDRDVRHDADDCDGRNKRAKRFALAIARGDEIGDGRDVLLFGDGRNGPQHFPTEGEDKDRPDIDREEIKPRARRDTDGAEIGPGRAIDAQRQRIDIRSRRARGALQRQAVAPGGGGEEKPQIGEAKRQDHPALDHGSRLTRARAGPPECPTKV